MSFLTPLGLLAFLSLPAVLALHLFRRRYQERKVSSLFLWAPDLLRSHSGRKRTRLLRSPSLWIELLAATLVALALSGLSFGATVKAKPLVLVLDDSASMSAHDGASSVRDRIVAAIGKLLDSQGASARSTVILTGSHPRVWLGPDASAHEVRERLKDWKPQQAGHELDSALDMGRQMAEGGATLHLFTDSDPGAADRDYVIHASGRSLGNTALLGARRIPGDKGQKLFLDLLSLRDKPHTIRLEVGLLVEGTAPRVFRSTAVLEPLQVQHLSIDLPLHGGAIQIDLEDDALDLDNHILLLPERLRVVRLQQDLPQALASRLGITHLLDAIQGLELAGPGEVAALRLSTTEGPAAPWRTEFLIQVPETSTGLVGPFLVERRHPLLRGTQFDGVIWSASESTPPKGFPLVLAGALPLLTEEKEPRFRRYRLAIDPERSNLVKAPDWPILLSNLVDLVRRELPGQVGRNQASNKELIYRHSGPLIETSEMRLVTPTGTERPPQGLRELRFEPEGPGLYRLRTPDRELARWSLFFVDPAESDLRSRRSLSRAASASGEAGDARSPSHPGVWERKLLSLLLLLLLLADAWVLRREGSA